MKSATVKEIKLELTNRPHQELIDLCLQLSKFKKENKELLTYLLYEASDEDGYIESIKREVEEEFEGINLSSYYYIKKSVRKILRMVRKYIRYSKRKETEIQLLLHFSLQMKRLKPPMERDVALHNIYLRQLALLQKSISTLHEDLQYDYNLELEGLTKTE